MKVKGQERGSSAAKVQNKGGDSAAVKKLAQKQAERKPTFDKNLFVSGVAGYLRSLDKPPLPFEGDYATHPAVLESIEMFEIVKAADIEDYGDAVTALAAFKAWLDEGTWEYEVPVLYFDKRITVTMGMTTASGTLSVSMDASPTSDVETAAVIRAMKDDLQAALKEAFQGPFSDKKPLPETNGKKAKRTSGEDGKVEYETEEVHIVGLRCKRYEDKWYWNALPADGNWVQYGIPLYANVAKKFGIELPEESGEYDVDWLCVYELKEDGKPRRIIEIEDTETEAD